MVNAYNYITDQFQYPSMKRYVNDLTREMDDHLDNIREALKMFVQDGMFVLSPSMHD